MPWTYHWDDLIGLAKASVRNIPTATLDARYCDLVSSEMAKVIPWSPLITTIAAGSIPLADGVQDYSVPMNFMGLVRDVRLCRTDLTPSDDVNLQVVSALASNSRPRSPMGIRLISHEDGIGQLRLESAVSIPSDQTWEIRGEVKVNPTKITNTNQGCWFDDRHADVAVAGVEYWLRRLSGDASAGTAVTDGKGQVQFTGQLGVFRALLRDMQKAEDNNRGEIFMFPAEPLATGRDGGYFPMGMVLGGGGSSSSSGGGMTIRHSPAETPDGARTSFTFDGLPNASTRYQLTVNGLTTNSGFTQAGNVITFSVAPDAGTEIYCYY